jgi:putative endopeptidase
MPTGVKSRYQQVGEAIRAAFKERIERLDWMSDTTKQNAQLKLAALTIQIGYPDTWADVSKVRLERDALLLNLDRLTAWAHDATIQSLRAPVDRTAWQPGPTMRDAGYDDSNNKVTVEPASFAIPGWRDDELDDAIIYGYTFLGHEISHAFDSEGRHYDAHGNRTDWWTARDAAAFQARARVLIDEYSDFSPVEGLHLDGSRTLRENIADVAGVRVALDAFKKTEQFRSGEKIGGFTPLQRFFLAFAARQMSEARPQFLAMQVRTDLHAPDRERVNGVLANIPEFYEAFDVKPGDRMYRAENARVAIW